MRIVLLPSAYAPAVGGVEVLTARLAHHLVALGHAVEVWTIRHPAELPAVEVIEGVTVRRFAMAMPAGSVGQLARFGPGAWRAISQMRHALREFSADVLHVQCFSANGVYAAALSSLLRVPLVVSLQGETVMDDNDIYDRSASLRLGLRAGLRAAAQVTGCSAFVLEDAVRRFGLPPGAGQVVPNGVDLTELPAPEPLEPPFGRFIVALGRVVAKKGFDLLIDAFAALGAGLPVVLSSHGGAGEIVRDGYEGLVADPFDAEAFAGAIARVLDDQALAGRLSQAGLSRVADFAWEKITDRYVQLYVRALRSP